MKLLTFAAALILAFGQAQTALKNQDIIDLSKAGLSAEIITAKIKASTVEFDTSVQALQELKKAGVADGVLVAMVEAATKGKAPETPQPKAPTSDATNALPEYGSASELKDLKKVYVTSEELDSRKLILWQLGRIKDCGLEIVDSPDEAEIILDYKVMSSTESRGRQRSHYLRSELVAYKYTEQKRKRILWSDDETYEESSGMSFSRPNEINLTIHFLAALKRGCGTTKR